MQLLALVKQRFLCHSLHVHTSCSFFIQPVTTHTSTTFSEHLCLTWVCGLVYYFCEYWQNRWLIYFKGVLFYLLRVSCRIFPGDKLPYVPSNSPFASSCRQCVHHVPWAIMALLADAVCVIVACASLLFGFCWQHLRGAFDSIGYEGGLNLFFAKINITVYAGKRKQDNDCMANKTHRNTHNVRISIFNLRILCQVTALCVFSCFCLWKRFVKCISINDTSISWRDAHRLSPCILKFSTKNLLTVLGVRVGDDSASNKPNICQMDWDAAVSVHAKVDHLWWTSQVSLTSTVNPTYLYIQLILSESFMKTYPIFQ